jgi:hypothetical protein
MQDATYLSGFAGFLETHIFGSAPLAAIGFATVIGLAAMALFGAGRLGLRLAHSPGNTANGKVRKAAAEPGYIILFGEISGTGQRQVRAAIVDALERHLSSFCFGAIFRLFPVTKLEGRPEGATLRRARHRLEKSQADMIVWGEQIVEEPDRIRLYGVSRGGSLSPYEASAFAVRLPAFPPEPDEAEAEVVAYLLAKKLQPALARPESFRPERVEELARRLDTLLASDAELTQEIEYEIESDFSTIVLHLSDAELRPDLLEEVVVRRRARLEMLKTAPDEAAMIDARLDLGQALIRLSESRFDPVAVREATVHLNAVVDTLKAHEEIGRAHV